VGDARSGENALVGREWRERALELEARCLKLEEMFEWDKLGTKLNGSLRERGQLVKISTERLVGTNTAGHGTADKGKKREKRGETENRTRIGLERVLSGKMAGHGLDGERAL
jgi:hypothetical protein